MAKAKTFVRNVRRTISVEVPGYVELNLTPEEASALHRVLRRVGGSLSGPRGLTADILSQLTDVGVTSDHLKLRDEPGARLSGIEFA